MALSPCFFFKLELLPSTSSVIITLVAKLSSPLALFQMASNICGPRHCVKIVRIRSYAGPHFPAFGLNTVSI